MKNVNHIMSQAVPDIYRPKLYPPRYDSDDIAQWQEDFKEWARKHIKSLEDFKQLNHYDRLSYIRLCSPSKEIKSFQIEYLKICLEQPGDEFTDAEIRRQLNQLEMELKRTERIKQRIGALKVSIDDCNKVLSSTKEPVEQAINKSYKNCQTAEVEFLKTLIEE